MIPTRPAGINATSSNASITTSTSTSTPTATTSIREDLLIRQLEAEVSMLNRDLFPQQPNNTSIPTSNSSSSGTSSGNGPTSTTTGTATSGSNVMPPRPPSTGRPRAVTRPPLAIGDNNKSSNSISNRADSTSTSTSTSATYTSAGVVSGDEAAAVVHNNINMVRACYIYIYIYLYSAIYL